MLFSPLVRESDPHSPNKAAVWLTRQTSTIIYLFKHREGIIEKILLRNDKRSGVGV